MPDTTTTTPVEEVEAPPPTVECGWCGEEVDEGDALRTGGLQAEAICGDCFDDSFSCANCATLHHLDNGHHTVDGMVCDRCYRNDYLACESCDEVYHHEDTHMVDDDETWCQNCVDRYARWCDDCETYHADEEGRHGGGIIANYSFKPRPVFFQRENRNGRALPGVLYVGIELEVERHRASDSPATLAEMVASQAGEQRSLLYFKSDGSLTNGFEIVTHPMTVDWAMSNFPWHALTALSDKGAGSAEPGTCGLHVHVSRSAFKATHMWRFLNFHYLNPHPIQVVAQRPSGRWASWNRVDSEAAESLKYAKGEGANGDRYEAVNLRNRDTVELRYFRGSLSEKAVKKNLQFVQAVYDYTRGMGTVEAKQGGLDWSLFSEWVRGHTPSYPQLVEFMDVHSL